MKKLLPLFACVLSVSLQAQQLTVTQVATGFNIPVDLKNCGDDRLFIVEKPGYIRIIDSTGATMPSPFIDIHSRVLSTGNEQGLLGLAFDPNYAVNGYFYVDYTTQTTGNTHISRFTVSSNPDSAIASSEEVLLEIYQPYANHNGGNLSFGPDGYLYIGMGDGGSGGDPGNRAQNKDSLLGKILRIDVSTAPGYANPQTNPFVGVPGRDEIWAYGVRNPWRFSFDRLTGDMWIGDVGQSAQEEVDFQPKSSHGGENYGWRCYEGTATYNTSGNCPPYANTAQPVYTYTHGGGNCSITGGYIYRGAEYATLYGQYFFTDYCVQSIRSLRIDTAVHYHNYGTFAGSSYVSFGENRWGEMYIVSQGGTIYKLGDTTCLPVAHLADSDTLHVCGATSVTLSTPAGKNFTYTWTANGSTVPGNNQPTLFVNAAGTYSVAVMNPANCTNISSDVYVSFDPMPTVTLGGLDTQYCANTSLPDTLVGVPVGGTFSGSGITGNVFDPAAAGTGTHSISYRFTSPAGCTDSVVMQTNVVICQGIVDPQAAPVTLVPNPFNTAFEVHGATRAEIFNTLGEKIMDRQINRDTERLDATSWRAGVYFVKLYTGDKTVVLKAVKE